MDVQGPYKATKLWNDIIRTFRTSMPVGRHRKGVRIYDNCFQASDAVDWLQLHLSKNPSFGSDVGRHQVVQLLGKFHKSGVFHDVRSGGAGDCGSAASKYDAEPFEDSSSRLFKFSLVETTLSPLSAHQPITAMERSVGRRSLRAGPSWSGRKSSSLSASSSGAMCATPVRRMPQPRESSHQQQKQPQLRSTDRRSEKALAEDDLTYIWLDSALTRIRELLELRSVDALTDTRLLRAEFVRDNLTAAGLAEPADTLPAWVANAVRCLARWPDSGLPSLPSYDGFELDIFAALCEFFEGRDPDPLVPCELRDLFVNVLALADNLAGERAARDAAARRRQRRRLRRHQQRDCRLGGRGLDSLGSLAMTSSCAEIMRQLAAPPAAAEADGSIMGAGCSADTELSLLHQPRCRRPRVCHSDCEFDDIDDEDDVDDPAAAEDANVGGSRLRRLRRSPLRRSAASEVDGLGDDFLRDDFGAAAASDGFCGDIHPIDGDSLLASGLQLATLFLPPNRRRRLHQLLRAMHKLSANQRLRLDPLLPTPHVVLHSLAACVLRRPDEGRQSQQPPDVFALQLVSFMTDHYSVIFRPPADLRDCVEARLAAVRDLQLSRQASSAAAASASASSAEPSPPAAPAWRQQQQQQQYCSRIPAEQFSLSGRLASDQALLDLLEGLLSDENLPAREKRRKLRLFKESHPHVYAARFPDPEVERSVLDSLRGPPAAPGLLSRTLAALKNWRL